MTDPTLWENAHAHLLIGVYRTSFRLLRSGAFTASAMCAELKRSFASGYRDDEVYDALAWLVRNGDLGCDFIVNADGQGCVYRAGSRFPLEGLFAEDQR